MKIGAGGLQAIIAQDAARGLDASRIKTAAEESMLHSEDPVLRKLLYDLNKAVERMRRAAEAYNLPLNFQVRTKDKKKPRIAVLDRKTGEGRDITLEEAEDWLEQQEKGRGRSLNGYV